MILSRRERAATDGNGIEPQDVDVLKLLYLVRYVDDVKANLDNIVILMADECIGKHNNCLPGGFRHQPEFSFFHSIRGHGKDTQTHSAGSRADGHGIAD